MAITLVTAPQNHSPAYNPIEYTFSSGNSSQCDFKYIADLYVNSAFVVRLKSFPDLNGIGSFRLERILQDYLSVKFGYVSGGGIDYVCNNEGFNLVGSQHLCSYYLEIREDYNTSANCTGSSTTSAILYTSGVKYSWNGALSIDQFFTFTEAKYLATDSKTNWLTNKPKRILLPKYEDGLEVIAFMQTSSASPSGIVYDIIIKSYDSNNLLINTITKITLISPSVNNDKIIYFTHSPYSINLITPSTGTQPVVTDATIYYTIQLRDYSANAVTKIQEYEIDNRCSKYNHFRLYWQNRIGLLDSYHFPMLSKQNVSIDRNNFSKSLSANPNKPYDRSEQTLSVNATQNYSCVSNWMTEEESKWIEELFTSPEVYATYKEIIEVHLANITVSGSVLYFDITSQLIRPEELTVGNEIKFVLKSYEHNITGAAYNAMFVDFIISDGGETIPNGTVFDFNVINGTAIGMPNSGSGTILGYNGSSYQTDIPCTINAGSLITGTIESISTINSKRIDTCHFQRYNGGLKNRLEFDIPSSATVYNPTNGGSLFIQLTKTIPVIITSNTYEQKIKNNIKNINYQIDFRNANSKNIQSK